MSPVSSPKYSLPEIERRWLVDPAIGKTLDPNEARRLEDLYIDETRLRLRQMTSPDGTVVRKLCKKYGSDVAGSEPITNLYLDQTEYARLSELAGARTMKRRHAFAGGSLDVYEVPSPGLAIFEIEFRSQGAADSYAAPSVVAREITGDARYSGAALALAARRNAKNAMDAVYHLVGRSELHTGLSARGYFPQRFASDGFVHCASTPEITLAVAWDYFHEIDEPLVVLRIEVAQLTSRVLLEAPAPLESGGRAHLATAALFPHIYGPIDRTAIAAAAVLRKDADRFLWPERFEALSAI